MRYKNALGQSFSKMELKPNFLLKALTLGELASNQLNTVVESPGSVVSMEDNAWSREESGRMGFGLSYLIKLNGDN